MDDDRDKNDKDSMASESQTKDNVHEKRVYSVPENPPNSERRLENNLVSEEKKPTRQMTGGPDKPTA